MNKGWKCPVCGRGVAPTVKTCDHAGDSFAAAPVYIPSPIYIQPRGFGFPPPVMPPPDWTICNNGAERGPLWGTLCISVTTNAEATRLTP
jgi:hypothetical protein